MSTLLREFPRDAKTIAAIRRTCAGRGFPARCTASVCRRTRQCRAPWEKDIDTDMLLPPCVAAAYDAATRLAVKGDFALIDLGVVVAEAMELPHPQSAAEFDTFDLSGIAAPGGFDPDAP